MVWERGAATREDRWAALGQQGATIWLTGLPASGKSAIAAALEARLVGGGRGAYLIDGDNLRHGLSGDLGFDAGSRAENVRRAGEAARMLADAGLVVIVALVSPYAEHRDRVRRRHAEDDLAFVEVCVDTPLEVCEERDPKGLYRRARARHAARAHRRRRPLRAARRARPRARRHAAAAGGRRAARGAPRGPRTAVTSYLVCATPRSGSTLLCKTLAETGVAGDPEEFFEAVPGHRRAAPAARLPRRARRPRGARADRARAAATRRRRTRTCAAWASYAEHLERVREWGTTPNGVFGAKIMWAHLEDLGRQLDSHDLPALVDTVFDRPRLVWVRRADTVRQAVSLWRAMQTQSWRAENEPDAGEPQYSFAALRHLVELLTAHDACWERFFAAAGADVLTVGYDDLSTDLAGVLARTLDHIGVAAPDGALDALPRLRRQADERSDAWAAAYARDAMLAAR